ncbi:hypothetical protein EJA72_11570 [Pseudomonas sp. PB120]|jgi:hypothetical protein|uniref:hypothetical protein n=1 Tax=Pseudomonas TaxID=286 RepID=UPI0012FD200F|nr:MULTISPECIES: hypothetical protein [Pseudomonas]MDD2098766.1 hypothetical protein [Pseudomonas putida]MVV48878.1 hypothetical protein [Pseudomonas sp. PB120]
MNEYLDHLSANDNDIYDLLISGKQRMTVSVLRELLRDRGIFCSAKDEREDICDYISMIPHGFHDIEAIVDKREPPGRRDKTTNIQFDSEIALDDIREAVESYMKTIGPNEEVKHRIGREGGYVIKVEYDEFNHNRAKLLQRERNEAKIDFLVENGKTVVRLPATDKAKRVVEAIKECVEQRRKAPLAQEKVELAELSTPELRSKFFTSLISKLPGFKLRNVMNLKVSSLRRSEESDENLDIDLDTAESEARMEMFAVVHSMALSGQNLVQSKEYKELSQRGFYITHISWKSEQIENPPNIVQFEAGFEDKQNCLGFRYGVQGEFKYHKGSHRKGISPVEDKERARYFSLIEQTALKLKNELLAETEG